METEAELIDSEKETHDVKRFKFKPEEEMDFIPGQYCLVSFINQSKYPEGQKPFTFANSPTEKEFIELAVKKMGKFTTALHSLEKREKIRIEGPKEAVLEFKESEKDIIFLAGGSGITPFMSILRYSIDKNLPKNFTLIFSNRAEGDIIYQEELEEMNKKDNIQVINTLTQEHPDGWDGESGRIDSEMIKKYWNGEKNEIYYICGPPPMVTDMRKILSSLGIEEKQIRFEDWQIPGKHDKEIEKNEDGGGDMPKVFWKCKICGDVHYGEAGPDVCPTCSSKDVYERIEKDEAKEIMGL
jgi:NAD(P)H-flavin reductase